MTKNKQCTIGISGRKWGDAQKKQWFLQQTVKRSYQEQVLSEIDNLKHSFDVVQYGVLDTGVRRYPLYAIKSKNWQYNKKTVLVTGGVHGYETSGIHGALRFLQNEKSNPHSKYQASFNLLVVPCISPWGYETINRWNHKAIDPNRSFYDNSPAQESAALMAYVQSLNLNVLVHVDLHETTDTDNTEFRPALAARDAIEQKTWNIPDGFYLVGDAIQPQEKFQSAIINSVEKITHIAPPDDDGKLIGVPVEQKGVINYAGKALGLCMGLTCAPYVTTTEVYPDSTKVDDENCILAQVAAITGALDYLMANE
ncbi:MAG: M14 family metallocarboxypeptidase [Litorilituus sp.]|jgi:hypothetical protein|nr:M14 family metallocarboxypeptidase [Litorilituus sp.]